MSGHQMKETAPIAEGKKVDIGYLFAAVVLAGYALFTGVLIYGTGHLPSSKGEFILLGVFLYSVTFTLWSLTLARGGRPGFFTYVVGMAGVFSLFYGMYFFA